MIAAIYARVSTKKQEHLIQTSSLRELAGRHGWPVVVYLETASGKRGDRPVLAKLLADAKAHKFDVVLVWKIDRFGRSVRDLVMNVQTLDLAGVRFWSVSDSIDTDKKSPTATLLLHILASVAEFEATLIRDRTMAGQQAYRQKMKQGKVGKDREEHSKSRKDLPVGRPRKIFNRVKAQQLRDEGMSWRKIAKVFNVDQTTIRNALKKKPE